MNAYSQYRSYQAETSSVEDRVALLYDGARRFVDRGLSALEAGRLDAASEGVGKAQNILTELSTSLDFEAGGELAQNLWRLYDYWIWRLGDGLTKRDHKPLQEVSTALADMHEAWVEAAKQIRVERSMRASG